ncbi:MAG: AMP-binding protein [Actinobacteria bacterium]|nr:AMP-binding protein [Actinomycetota bacterium]
MTGRMDGRSYTHGEWTEPLLGTTLGQVFHRTAERFPDSDALVAPGESFRATYSELLDVTGRLARGLIARGVRRGDRVGLWSANRHEWVVAQIALARIGAVLVPVNPAYRRSELEYGVNRAEISFLLMAPAFRATDFTRIVETIRPSTPSLREVVVFDADWHRLLADGDSVPDAQLADAEAAIEPDDLLCLMYTSGTTGAPKGAMLSHRGQVNNGFLIGEGLSYTSADRICLPVPLFHSFGNLLGVLAAYTHGSTIVLCGEAFDPAVVLQTVAAERCTSLYGVPTMFIAELGLPDFEDYDLSTLRTGIMAGAPCPIEVMRKVHGLMHMEDVVVMYGMTETGITTRTMPGDPFEKQIGSVGRAMPLQEIKVVDDDGTIVARGRAGELCARGISTMLGYWEDEGATATAIDRAGWMHTGDVATLDDDGYLNIVGRTKDMIIRGGENVFPAEIEGFLYTHEAVEEVQVVGVPSERYGGEVMAFVRLRADAPATEEELLAFCRGAIATYKIPKHWKFVDEFPMTPSGKVQKYRLRQMAVAELGLETIERTKTA